MDTEERTAIYLESLDKGNTEFLDKIEKKAIEDGVPIVRHSSQSLMKFLLASHKPNRILEIGAAVGFSAILMAEYSLVESHITTIENYERRLIEARQNIIESGYSDRIELLEGDAMEYLEKLSSENKCYDMIFVDAAKGQYINYLPYCKKMLRSGGLLVTDNVLFDGDIIESRFAVRRRDRTIHARMREFLKVLSDDNDFVTSILPIADGMTMSIKK